MIKYKKQATAFIDILGFSNIVFNTNTEIINSYFSFLTKKLKEISTTQKIKYFYISDSIIFTTDATIENFYKLIKTVQLIQSSLLQISILSRGAITIGDLYLNKGQNIIVGPSLITSYKLEQEAKYPRVIIDRQVLKYFNFNNTSLFLENIHDATGNNIAKLVKVDSDNYIYIHYMAHFFSRRQNFTSKGTVKKLYDLIQKQFFDNLFLEKYSWLKQKCIEELEGQVNLLNQINPIAKTSIHDKKIKIDFSRKWMKKFEEI